MVKVSHTLLNRLLKSKDAEEKTQEIAAATKDGTTKKDKKEMQQISKGSKTVKPVDPAHSRTTSKDIQSVMPRKDASKLDTGLITDEDDDDSDVAAPEYYYSPLMQMAHHKNEGLKVAKGKEKVLENGSVAHLKNDVKKQNDGQAMKPKHADIKQPEMQDGGIRIQLPHKAQNVVNAVVKSMDDTAAKHLSTDGSFGFISKPYSLPPLTTVVRIINLPHPVTGSKLKALCETVARVHEVNFRRRHIADVHFNVDLQEMSNVLNRTRAHSLILEAIRLGYRHFDCAADYKNEKEVGQALAEALRQDLVKRSDLFITTKLWNSDHGHVGEACEDSLKNLQLDYLDLYLIHFPVATRHTGVGNTRIALDSDGVLDIDVTISLETTWHAMEDLVSAGLVQSIGIRIQQL